jgi:membrane fusion protein (multidrug efflux system)
VVGNYRGEETTAVIDEQEYERLRDEIQRLRDEQQRLRDEQEKLRCNASQNGNKPEGSGGGAAAGKDGDQKSEGQESKAKQEGKPEQSGGEKGKEGGQGKGSSDQDKQKDGEKKEEEEPKPPLRDRVNAYVNTHRKGVLLGAVGFVAAVALAIVLVIYLYSYESTDDAEVDGHLNAIGSRVAGTVVRIYVEDNQTVAAGQSVVDLDPSDYQMALEQANASYAQAQAQLSASSPNVPIIRTSNQTTITTGQSDVAAAQSAVGAAEQEYQARLASVRQSEANNIKAQKDVQRYQALVVKEEISHEQFDTVVAAAKTQAAAVEAAEASAKASQKSIEQARDQLQQALSRLAEANQNAPHSEAIRRAEVATKQASLEAAKAQADQAALNLSYTKIIAPVAGIVSDKTVEVGQQVAPGEQLFVISQTGDIWITANFKETQLRKMQAGQTVDIKVDAFGTKYEGYIESMPGATGAKTSLLPPENATGNYVKVVQRLPVRIRLKNGEDPEHRLRPGMSVEPKVWLR